MILIVLLLNKLLKLSVLGYSSLVDPNLEIRGEGQGVSSRPGDKGGGMAWSQKFFLALWASVSLV